MVSSPISKRSILSALIAAFITVACGGGGDDGPIANTAVGSGVDYRISRLSAEPQIPAVAAEGLAAGACAAPCGNGR